MLVSDNYFHIGAAHISGGKPCQDYALSHANESRAVAIVSDGCSSGGKTDLGSRLVAHCTNQSISRTPVGVPFHEWVNKDRDWVLNGSKALMGLNNSDMLATCSYVVVDDNRWTCQILGDGVVVEKYNDGMLLIRQVTWSNNTPYYPAYTDSNRDRFIEIHSDSSLPCEIDTWAYTDKGLYNYEKDFLSAEQGINEGFLAEYKDPKLEAVAIFSDGITQIDGLDWKDAAVKMMDFKTTSGEFLKRRMIRVIKESQKSGRGPIDDISGAIILRES